MRKFIPFALAIALVGCSSNSKQISESDFNPYPFTVGGSLECESPEAVILKANGNIYPLNGAARTKYQSIAKPLEEIWKDDPKLTGKINIGDVLSTGLRLCRA